MEQLFEVIPVEIVFTHIFNRLPSEYIQILARHRLIKPYYKYYACHFIKFDICKFIKDLGTDVESYNYAKLLVNINKNLYEFLYTDIIELFNRLDIKNKLLLATYYKMNEFVMSYLKKGCCYDDIFEMSVKSNNLEIFYYIIQLDGFNPSIKNNIALLSASKYGYTEIVKELLKDSRVDPNMYNGYPFILACEYGHIDIVKELFSHRDRIQYLTCCDKALAKAAKNSHYDVVKFLLDNGNFGYDYWVTTNRSFISNYYINIDYDILELILNHPNIDKEHVFHNSIILLQNAVKTNRLDIIKLLLSIFHIKYHNTTCLSILHLMMTDNGNIEMIRVMVEYMKN